MVPLCRGGDPWSEALSPGSVSRFGSDMSEVIYVSKVRIERFGGGHRRAHLPVGEPADFGVHDEIAEHYGMTPGQFEPHAATLDYVVAAAGG